MNEMIRELKESVKGEVFSDPIHRSLYAVDASMFEVQPLAVFIPKDKSDILKALRIARKHQTSVIARGAATSTTGAALGKGLIIDTTKYLNKVLEINLKEEWVRVEPGVVQDQLNVDLAPHGYRLGPDTSSGSRATIGGMIGNNSSGARSLKFGTTFDALLEVDLSLMNGDSICLKELSDQEYKRILLQNNSESTIYKEIESILKTNKDEIEKRYPKLSKQAAGYCLDKLLKQNSVNLAKLIVGSEGSLGIVTEAKLKIIKKPKYTGLCVFQCPTLSEAINLVPKLLTHQPLSLELVDEHIISMAKKSPALSGSLNWLHSKTNALIIFEQDAEEETKVQNVFSSLKEKYESSSSNISTSFFYTDSEQEKIWNLRKSGLSLLMSQRSYKRGYAFIEDLIVPPESLNDFVLELEKYLLRVNKQAGIYGHAGAGLVHVRPFINLLDNEDVKLMTKIMKDVTAMILKYKGSLTGEHGDGLLRSYLNPIVFGEKIYETFKQIKKVFDPNNLMNPGKVIGDHQPYDDLRVSEKTKFQVWDPFLDFSKEGGLPIAVDLCNGNALCRKPNATMCPSFQATQDEKDSTRARAQLLRSYINGRLNPDQFMSKASYDVFDLCLECKGCKKECPSQVDIAKLKPEFLYQYYKIHKPSLRTKFFAHLDTLSKIAQPLSFISNPIMKSKINKHLLSYLGFSPELSLPSLSSFKFSNWIKKYKQTGKQHQKVILFIDTYTEFYRPQVGIAAVKVLNALGVFVETLPWTCCGRPALSKGFLEKAQGHAQDVFNRFLPHLNEGIPLIGLEPSCTYTLKDELFSLIPKKETELFSDLTLSFETFVLDLLKTNPEKQGLFSKDFNFALHNHCHQKSSSEERSGVELLELIGKAKLLPTGCCGMAGSFAFEKEHYAISQKVAKNSFIPHITKLSKDTTLIANGFSCQHQAQHSCNKKPKHLSEALFEKLETR
jgi:FAD/FMN-containing dehydrogenase/Fe-S oxidoreductase